MYIHVIWRLYFNIRIGALETNARSRVERTFRVFPYTRSTTTIFEVSQFLWQLTSCSSNKAFIDTDAGLRAIAKDDDR